MFIVHAHWAAGFEKGSRQQHFVDLVGNLAKALTTHEDHLRKTAELSAAAKDMTEQEKQRRMDERVRPLFRDGCEAAKVPTQYKALLPLMADTPRF